MLTVTLNPARDVTYTVDALSVGEVHRVSTVRRRAGGKGVNVARVLHQLGVPVTAGGLLAGSTGRELRDELEAAGLASAFVELAEGETRHTVTVVDERGVSTLLNEPGPRVDERAVDLLSAELDRLAQEHTVVVFSGSLPPGLPPETYRTLVRVAKRRGARTVLDTSGAWLRLGVEARPDLVKPNRDELLETTGLPDVPAAAAALREAGAGAVAVSLGPDGVLLDTPAGRWRTPAAEHIHGNATGAGDAAVAGLALGLLRDASWSQLGALAVAAGTAALHRPTAGEIDLDVFTHLHEQTRAATGTASNAAALP